MMDLTKDPKDWLEDTFDYETVLLVDGPLDGEKTRATVKSEGPFRHDIAGKGIAQYQRIARRSDGAARARFIGYE